MHNKYQYKEPQNGGEVNMQDNGQQNMKNGGENVASLNQNPYVNGQMGNMQQPQMQQTQQGFAQNQQQNNQNPYINNQMNMQNSFANPYMNAQGLNQNPYSQNQYMQTQNMQNPNTFTSKVAQNVNHIFDNKFLLGVVVGGVATYLLTNDDAQKAIIKTGMKLFSKVAGGVEEIKEKIMDAQAEIEQEKEDEKSL